MIEELIEKICIRLKKRSTTDFSTFFQHTSTSKKKRVLKSVIREANKDQQDLLEKYKVSKNTA